MCSVVSNCPGSCFLQGKREVLSRSIVLHIFPYAWQQDARHATAGPQGFDQVSISGSPLVKCLVVYLQTCEVGSWSPHSTVSTPTVNMATWCCKFLLFRRSEKVYQTSGQNIINILGTSWSLSHWSYFVFGQNMALVPGPITTTTDLQTHRSSGPTILLCSHCADKVLK